jgi:hypothetical protein
MKLINCLLLLRYKFIPAICSSRVYSKYKRPEYPVKTYITSLCLLFHFLYTLLCNIPGNTGVRNTNGFVSLQN